MQASRPKTLEEILRGSTDARRYMQEMRGRIAERYEREESARLDCPQCGGLGVVRAGNVPVGHPAFGKLFPCPNPECSVMAANRARRYEKLCTLAQIPKEYLSNDLTIAGWARLIRDYPDYATGKLDAYGAALAFLDAQEREFRFTLDEAAAQVGLEQPDYDSRARNSIVYSGANGVGKTSLAVSIARTLLDEGVQVVYVRFSEFFDALKERFQRKDEYELGGDADDETGVLSTYQEAPVLIIDEFYADVTSWRKERAEQLINHRYTQQLPTLITTNLNADQMIGLWGMTTGHRIQAMAHWIIVGGRELRRRDPARESR